MEILTMMKMNNTAYFLPPTLKVQISFPITTTKPFWTTKTIQNKTQKKNAVDKLLIPFFCGS